MRSAGSGSAPPTSQNAADCAACRGTHRAHVCGLHGGLRGWHADGSGGRRPRVSSSLPHTLEGLPTRPSAAMTPVRRLAFDTPASIGRLIQVFPGPHVCSRVRGAACVVLRDVSLKKSARYTACLFGLSPDTRESRLRGRSGRLAVRSFAPHHSSVPRYSQTPEPIGAKFAIFARIFDGMGRPGTG